MSMTANTESYRWDHYFLRRDNECSAFWRDYLSTPNRRPLFVLGLGFDSRMCFGLQMLMNASRGCVKECLLIEYDEGENSPSHQYDDLVKKNLDDLSGLMDNAGVIQKAQVSM